MPTYLSTKYWDLTNFWFESNEIIEKGRLDPFRVERLNKRISRNAFEGDFGMLLSNDFDLFRPTVLNKTTKFS